MKKFGFITNKFAISILILMGLLLADILLHREMSRVILPSSFPENIKSVNLPICGNTLAPKDKHWIKSVDNIALMEKLPANTAGIQCNVVFNTLKNIFELYPDAASSYSLDADSLLTSYTSKKLTANFWFTIRNLTIENTNASLKEILRLKNKYGLNGQIIVESSHAALLKPFCDSGFFTSYYAPFLNPYQASEPEIMHFTDSIRNTLSKYPASSISCFYFQYPVLKKFFPNYPLLTRSDQSSISMVSYVFRHQLENDVNIKAILYPFQDSSSYFPNW
ncbi:hypothetical protein BH11BAC4_BH11BAC4_09850 [soil metagenome]